MEMPFLQKMLLGTFAGISIGFILFIFSVWLNTGEKPTTLPQKRSRWQWIIYSIPMILVWTIYLFTFWPGLMSSDSFGQWHEIVTGVFYDAHPAIHTLTMWLITRLWFSPAISDHCFILDRCLWSELFFNQATDSPALYPVRDHSDCGFTS
jgi:hypothetical protein